MDGGGSAGGRVQQRQDAGAQGNHARKHISGGAGAGVIKRPQEGRAARQAECLHAVAEEDEGGAAGSQAQIIDLLDGLGDGEPGWGGRS